MNPLNNITIINALPAHLLYNLPKKIASARELDQSGKKPRSAFVVPSSSLRTFFDTNKTLLASLNQKSSYNKPAFNLLNTKERRLVSETAIEKKRKKNEKKFVMSKYIRIFASNSEE